MAHSDGPGNKRPGHHSWMPVVLAVGVAFGVGSCGLGYGDPNETTWVQNRDSQAYVIRFTSNPGGFDRVVTIPAASSGMALASMKFDGWTGIATLLDVSTCEVMSKVKITSDGDDLVIAGGQVRVEKFSPDPDREFSETTDCSV